MKLDVAKSFLNDIQEANDGPSRQILHMRFNTNQGMKVDDVQFEEFVSTPDYF